MVFSAFHFGVYQRISLVHVIRRWTLMGTGSSVTIDDVFALIKETEKQIAVLSQDTANRFKETADQVKETSDQMKETDRRLKELAENSSKQIEALSKNVGNISKYVRIVGGGLF
jgi:methyl-accepting chemotaxis protein